MLALTLKVGQKLKIGPDIEIILSEVSSGRAKLGISAPKEVGIERQDCRKKGVLYNESRSADR